MGERYADSSLEVVVLVAGECQVGTSFLAGFGVGEFLAAHVVGPADGGFPRYHLRNELGLGL